MTEGRGRYPACVGCGCCRSARKEPTPDVREVHNYVCALEHGLERYRGQMEGPRIPACL